jgi:molecular chaperone DnaK
MSYAVGIDLGTVNSVVSVYRRGVVETISIDGRPAMPSVVSFRNDGSVLIGAPAKSRLLLDPANTVASIKRFMGDHAKVYHVGHRALSPVDISSLVLRRLVQGAQEYLGEDVWDAVITVPAYFTEAQREDTKRAGEEAGLNVLRLIPEPTAAAIAYGLDKGRDQTIMVYDLGGGTFDISILQVRGNHFEVKAVGGNSRLGGDDFDQEIMHWASERFRAKTGLDILGSTSREAMLARQRLKEATETAKIELSQSEHAAITVPDCMGYPLDMEISRSDYNALIEPLLQLTVTSMRSVLRDAGLQPRHIDRVILVGGSTKNPAVRALIAREIQEPYIADRVDEVVAHGAAIMAANLFLPESVDTVPVRVSNVTGHSLGVDMLTEQNELVFQALIPRQTPYPCKRGHLGFTNRPAQEKVVLTVYRGEDSNPRQNTYLGQLTLPVAPPQQNMVPIGVIFELDADGIIHFTAVQLPSNLKSRPIVEYATEHNGALDVTAVEALLRAGDARAKTIRIKSE